MGCLLWIQFRAYILLCQYYMRYRAVQQNWIVQHKTFIQNNYRLTDMRLQFDVWFWNV